MDMTTMARHGTIDDIAYRAILDAVGAYVYTTDKDGYYTYANQLVLDLLGGHPLTEVLGKAFTDFITRATGVPVNPGDEFALKDFFKPGDEYVLDVVTKNNFKEIDPKSITKKELAKPVVKGMEALSEHCGKHR